MPQELNREQVELPSEKITVEEKLMHLEKLFKTKKVHKISHILKSSRSKLEAIITFLAILELIKCKHVRAEQTNNFNDIELTVLKI